MKKYMFLGSTVGVLLLFSIISYSQNLVQQQQTARADQEKTQAAGTSAADTATTNSTNAVTAERPREVTAPAPTTEEKSALSEIIEATASDLHGLTPSGSAAT